MPVTVSAMFISVHDPEEASAFASTVVGSSAKFAAAAGGAKEAPITG